MKIFCDDKFLFEISDIDYKLLEHDLLDVDGEIERRLEYIIKHKADQCYKRLKEEWDKKLEVDPDVKEIPCKRDEYVKYICSRKDYCNRAQREQE